MPHMESVHSIELPNNRYQNYRLARPCSFVHTHNKDSSTNTPMKTKHMLPWLIAATFLGGPLNTSAGAKTQTLSEPTEIQGVPC